MKKVIILSVSLIILLFSIPSCAPAVSQQEYDRINKELSEAQSQLASLQSKLAEAEALQAKHDDLSSKYDSVMSEVETMQTKYDELEEKYSELGAQYDELSEQYNVLAEGMPITEEDVEQALFEAINSERRDNGLNELEWNHSLDLWAQSHSRDMAEDQQLEYSEKYDVWQGIWQAAGYSTLDRLTSAALTIWKDSTRYERHFLNEGATVGAIAAVKSGDVFYITYFAHIK